MADGETYAFRGERFLLGEIHRSPGGTTEATDAYAVWDATDTSPYRQPVEWFSFDPAGWNAAWARFTQLEPRPQPAAPAMAPIDPGPVGAPIPPPGGPPGWAPAGPAAQSGWAPASAEGPRYGSPLGGFGSTGQLVPGDRVEVAFDFPTPQRRSTVAFRLILAVPHFFMLIAVGIAFGFVAIVAWFAALFTGRVPDGMAGFLASVIHYQTRVNAYLYLTTDAYPPFSLGPAPYPVTVSIPPPVQLNRLSVLFRIVLAIPASILIWLAFVGLEVASLIVWLVVLIARRMPPGLYQAVSSILRYQCRYSAWYVMLTATYPGGLFGDGPAVAAGTGAAGKLTLSSNAKSLVGVFLGLGAIFAVLYAAVIVPNLKNSARNLETLLQLQAGYRQLNDSATNFDSQSQNCISSQGGLSCDQAALRELSAAWSTFDSQLASMSFPSSAQSDAAQVRNDDSQLLSIISEMASTSSQAKYQFDARTLQSMINQFQGDFTALQTDLA